MPDKAAASRQDQQRQSKPHADNRYIDAILRHDKAMLSEIYTLFLPKIIAFVHHNQGTREDALDIFQDAIMVIYRQAEREGLVIRQSFYNYLYTVCKNLWLRELNRKAKMAQRAMPDDGWGLASEDASPNQHIEELQAYKLYMEKFAQLGEGCRQVLRHYFEGASMKAIAALMGFKSEGYAKKRKHVCQKKLLESIKADPRYKNIK